MRGPVGPPLAPRWPPVGTEQLAAGDDVDVDAACARLPDDPRMGGPGWPQVPWWHNGGMAGLAAPGRVGPAATMAGLIWAAEVL